MHFDSDQLRDYQFGLLDETEAAGIATHLESCSECRAELERIQQQFAALDVLQVQPAVSDKVLESILKSITPSRKTIPFRTTAILAVAASLAVVFGILRVEHKTENNIRVAAESGAAMAVKTPSRPAARTTQKSSLQNAMAPNTPFVRAEPTTEELRAQKPFAPASNIELNVLPRRDDVQLTIYNAEDLTLVRETRKLTLKRGWNWLQFMWSNTLIDPTSLSLKPKTHADHIEITQLVYPPRLNELARWTIFSGFSGEAEFELTYFTAGLRWNAFYEATLANDEQTMRLTSHVRVDNGSGEDYEDAQTRLVVGEINLVEAVAELAKRKWPYNRAMPDIQLPTLLGTGRGLMDMEDESSLSVFGERSADYYSFGFEQKQVLKQALSEYQLYTIEGRETIPGGWGKRLPSFDVQQLAVTNLYKYDEERWGHTTMRFLSFANTEECKLGETPLPDGKVRVFHNIDAEHRLSYVGATDIKYIPVGEDAELELGATQKVKIEPKRMRTQTANHEFDRKGNVSGWDEITNWKIEITNARDLPVEVEITRTTGSSCWEALSDVPYEKHDASHMRFTVPLEPRSKTEINVELTVHFGTRVDSN